MADGLGPRSELTSFTPLNQNLEIESQHIDHLEEMKFFDVDYVLHGHTRLMHSFLFNWRTPPGCDTCQCIITYLIELHQIHCFYTGTF